MRKRDPNVLVHQFRTDLASISADRELLSETAASRLAKRATMDAFTRTAVAFERFRSDWLIAAITRDASAFSGTQLRRAKAALEDTNRGALAPYLQVNIPKHPTLEQVGQILDASGGNVSIPSIRAWKECAKKHLAPPWRGAIEGILWEHAQAADAVISIRNAAAHQSPRSLSTMNEALSVLTDPIAHDGLRRQGNNVTLGGIPTYLHGVINSGDRRVEKYAKFLDVLAASLIV